MSSYSVSIIKTSITKIKVEASSPANAKRHVKDYGMVEAVSDFPVISEDVGIEIGIMSKLEE